MKRDAGNGAGPDPLALSIWEGFSELADWPGIAPSVDQALQQLEAFRDQKRADRRKAVRSASATLCVLMIVGLSVGGLVWRQEPQPNPPCFGQETVGGPSALGKGDRHGFAGMPLSAAIAEMNRSARRPIVLRGSWQDDYRLTADICLGDTDALASLLVDWGMARQEKMSPETIVLTATCAADCAIFQRG